MKRLSLLLILIIALVSLNPIISFAEEEPIKVKVNGELIEFDVPPTMISGRVLVPVRAIFEKLGLEVGWNESTQTVAGMKDGLLIELPVGKDVAYINGMEIKLDTSAMIIEGRTFVPVRFIAESLGADVSWDSTTRTVTIEHELTIEDHIKNSDISEELKVLKLSLVKMFDEETLSMDMNYKGNVENLDGDSVLSKVEMKTTGYMKEYDKRETSITSYDVEMKEGNKEFEFKADVIQVNDEVTIKVDYDKETTLELLNLDIYEHSSRFNEYKKLGINSYDITNYTLNFIYHYGQLFDDQNMSVVRLNNGDIKYTLELDRKEIQTKYSDNTILSPLLRYNEIDLSLVYIVDKDGYLKHVKTANKNVNDSEESLLNIKSIEVIQEIEISYNADKEKINKDIIEFNKKNTSKIFPDPWLEKAVRKTIDKPVGEITKDDLKGVTRLIADAEDIYDLEGIQYMKDLEILDLGFNEISDISLLGKLKKLRLLTLDSNKIKDIEPIENLTNLEMLSLDWNEVENIKPLENLTKLDDLSITDNNIEDITPLRKLVNLEKLHISTNKIKDITPLSNLINLSELYIYSNAIEDVSPLSSLENLKALHIYNNNIKDFSSLDKFKYIDIKLYSENE